MLLKAILVALWVSWGFIDEHTLQLQTTRAIVTGPVVGLIMGDLHTGLIVGATVEMMFLGSVFVGTAVAPDVTMSAAWATAFAIAAGGDTSVAIASAVAVAIIGQAMSTLQLSLVNVGIMHWAESGKKIGDINRIKRANYIALALDIVFYGIPTFLAVYFGSDKVTALMNALPQQLLTGLSNGGSMLGAVGFGMLLTTVKNKKLWPFFAVGYIAAAYLGLNNVGIGLVAIVCAFIHKYYLDKIQQVSTVNAGEDDDE